MTSFSVIPNVDYLLPLLCDIWKLSKLDWFSSLFGPHTTVINRIKTSVFHFFLAQDHIKVSICHVSRKWKPLYRFQQQLRMKMRKQVRINQSIPLELKNVVIDLNFKDRAIDDFAIRW